MDQSVGRDRRAGRPPKRLDAAASALAALGAELRRTRNRRGLTLIELGELIGYSWQHLGSVERGQVVPSEAVVSACEQALATGGRLTALFPAVVREQASIRHEREAMRHCNRPPNDEIDWARLAACARRPSRVSSAIVEELEAVTESQRTLYHGLPSAQMVVSVEAHLGLLAALLDGPQSDPTRHRIASAAGEAAGFAAWLWFDLGDEFKMASLYRLAADALAHAGNRVLLAYVMAYRALINDMRGMYDAASDDAEGALAWTADSASPEARSWLCAVSANVAARVDPREALRLLAAARDHLDGVGREGREEWMFEFDHGALAGYEGQCYLRIGQAHQARLAFEEALVELPETCERRRARLTMGLAEAHLARGEASEALDKARDSLAMFAHRGSVAGLRRVQRFHILLRDAGHRALAEELSERLLAYLRAAA